MKHLPSHDSFHLHLSFLLILYINLQNMVGKIFIVAVVYFLSVTGLYIQVLQIYIILSLKTFNLITRVL